MSQRESLYIYIHTYINYIYTSMEVTLAFISSPLKNDLLIYSGVVTTGGRAGAGCGGGPCGGEWPCWL